MDQSSMQINMLMSAFTIFCFFGSGYIIRTISGHSFLARISYWGNHPLEFCWYKISDETSFIIIYIVESFRPLAGSNVAGAREFQIKSSNLKNSLKVEKMLAR